MKIVPLEVGAYSNEALFHEIRATGEVDQFVTRYHSIGQEQLKNILLRGKDRASKALITAQEIVAVSVYDINHHIITHLKKRQGLGDMELASKLIKVQDTLEPAYLSAKAKYGFISPDQSQQQAQTSEATPSAPSKSEPSLSQISTVAASSSDRSDSLATLPHAKDIQRTLSSRQISSSGPGDSSLLVEKSGEEERTRNENSQDVISPSASFRKRKKDDSSPRDSPTQGKRTQSIEPDSDPQTMPSSPLPTDTQVVSGDVASHMATQKDQVVEYGSKPLTPPPRRTPKSFISGCSIQ